ncbi:MAG: hypothetical protein A2V66_13085 [Ignavibacteria bacterium RBG_13_36_8]|nr:MAG: hypothetical protein A2V66_13085 [Ignavibacteria bacterium RBG_13_36_8]
MENEFEKFLEQYEAKVISLNEEYNKAYFEASISGKKEDYSRASALQLKLNKIYSDKSDFAFLKSIKESGEINEPVLKRQVELIYNAYAGNQYNESLMEEIVGLSNRIEEEFATFRATYNGKSITDNQIDVILQNSTDNEELKNVWYASKQIGEKVAKDVVKLTKMRNQAARETGFKNYHDMSLKLSEQDPEEIDALFDNLDKLTQDEFAKLKIDMDEYLSNRYGVKPNELMPWHYQDKFFQHGPRIYKIDFDRYYQGRDLVEITRRYYNGMGMEIEDLIDKSDLFEKKGKYQHAYCSDIDREGDIRVLCNIKSNYKWMGTMLHEFGHAVYDKYISRDLPWELRKHSHIFTTEAIAMMFGRMASNPQWLQEIIGISEEENNKIQSDSFNLLRLEQLVFTRWEQVVYRFEKAMYQDPDQDLNELWWNLIKQYQLLKKPEGRSESNWAAKIHIALYPAYYHNYMLGELLASQLYHYIMTKILCPEESFFHSFVGHKDIGEYLKNMFFFYGASYKWNALIEKATGEKLTPKYFARQFLTELETL